MGVGVFYFTLARMDALGFGAVLAILSFHSINKNIWFRYLAAGTATILIPLFLVYSGSQTNWLQVVKLSLIPMFYLGVLGFIVSDPLSQPLNRWLSARPLRWLGTISYGLYVFHPACFSFINTAQPLLPALPALLVSFGLTTFCAWLSFHVIEKPALRFRERFPYPTSPGKRAAL